MKEFSKEYSSLWGFGVTDIDAIRFIENVKRSGNMESALPLVFTLTESNNIISQLEQETTPDLDSGECPLCEAVSESMVLLEKFIKNSEVNGHPIPERFIRRQSELSGIYVHLEHRRDTYLHPLTAKTRFQNYIDQNNRDIDKLLTSFAYTTESNVSVDNVTGIKEENQLVLEIAKKKFANEFVKLLDSPPLSDTTYEPQTMSELIKGVNKLTSLSNVCTILESERVSSLNVSDSLRAILESDNTGSSDDNVRQVASKKETPKQFTRMADKVLDDLKELHQKHEVEKLTNDLYNKFINILKYAVVFGVGSAVSPAITGIGIITTMMLRKHIDQRHRDKLIRDFETELRIVQSKINNMDTPRDEKYQLMRLESKLQYNIDRLKNKTMSANFNVGREY